MLVKLNSAEPPRTAPAAAAQADYPRLVVTNWRPPEHSRSQPILSLYEKQIQVRQALHAPALRLSDSASTASCSSRFVSSAASLYAPSSAAPSFLGREEQRSPREIRDTPTRAAYLAALQRPSGERPSSVFLQPERRTALSRQQHDTVDALSRVSLLMITRAELKNMMTM